jgi:hypothetical protein
MDDYVGSGDADMEEADYAVESQYPTTINPPPLVNLDQLTDDVFHFKGSRGTGKRLDQSLVSPRAQQLNEFGSGGSLFGSNNAAAGFNVPRGASFFGSDDFGVRDTFDEDVAPPCKFQLTSLLEPTHL